MATNVVPYEFKVGKYNRSVEIGIYIHAHVRKKATEVAVCVCMYTFEAEITQLTWMGF